jgi:vitamin B12 transporter
MTHYPSLVAAALAGLAASGSICFAEPAPTDTIIVTATRTEIPLRDATVPVSVISREEIELSMASDLAELLRFEAGIDLGRNGGAGQSTSVFLRGTESNHTLVLIDGVRINPGTIGGAAIQHVSPGLIERVEIVKGARSALFGTDAIGGVVNIITRRAEDGYFESSVGAGSFGTRSISASGGNRGEKGEFGITFNGQRTDGYAPRTDSPVERGYENRSANLYATRRFGTSELSFRHWQTGGTVEYLDFFGNPVDQDFENAASAVELVNRPTERSTSKLLVSYLRDDISQNQTEDFVESDRVSVDWQYTQAYAEHTVTGGLYGIDEKASTLSFGSGFDETTRVRAAFLQDQWSRGRHRSFLAARLTDHDAFGRHVTWNAEYAFEFGRDWTLNAGLGHAFRAPDATDRYGFGGSPDLEPEVADEAQLGLRYANDSGHGLEFELYANDIQDLIEFDPQAFALRNVAAAEIRGAQLAWEYRGDRFSVRAEVLKQRADDARTGERLIRRAEESATLTFVRNVGEHRLGLALIASGDREDLGGARLPGYVLADLTAQFALGRAWSLHARIENLLDTEYQTAEFYRMPERSAFAELKYRWD